MRKLMISLDTNILNKDSIVARRMIEYGKKDELFILIPDRKKETFDLSETVHVWSTGGNKIQQYFRLKKIGKKIIEDLRLKIEDSLITVQDPFFAGLVGAWLKKKTGLNLEVQLHGDFFNDYYKKKNLFKYWLSKFVVKKADKLRVVSQRIKKNLIKFNKIDEDKIEILPVRNDPELIKNYPTKIDLHNKYADYEKVFLVLGRLEPIKNIVWLADVFKEVVKQRNYLLLIVGRGSEEKHIRNIITRKNLDKYIKLQNWTEDPYGYLKTVDCVLFPSLSEGYGLVPMEANEIGTPVIMNDVGVANYELQPSDGVKILPINDREAWIKAILEI